MGTLIVVEAVIAAGDSESQAVDLGVLDLVGVIMPAGWTSPAIATILASPDGANFYDLHIGSKEVSFNVLSNAIHAVNPDSMRCARFIKLRSGDAINPVPQDVERTFLLVLQDNQAAGAADEGGALTFEYNAKTITQAMADPGNGFIVWSTVGQTDAAKLAISTRSSDAYDQGNFWRFDGIVGKVIVLQAKLDANRLQRFQIAGIIDHGTWFDVDVIPVSSSGALFGGNDPLYVAVI